MHGVENAPMNGLHAIADIGKSAADDYTHGVVDIAFFHLF